MPSLRAATVLARSLLAELVAPTRCAACEQGVDATALFCVACAATVERSASSSRRWRAAFEYGGAITTAITRLKYEGRADLGPRLGRAMAVRAAALHGRVDVVVPVPLHPRRLAVRGYNQAALLAAPVARSLGATFAPRALERTRDTPRQALLARAARLENLDHAFAVAAPDLLANARVLLVDDVRTTGATLDACATALERSGAARVEALVLARRA